LIRSEELPKLLAVMEQFSMPVSVSGLSAETIVLPTKSDKKMDSGTIRFILLEQIGKAFTCKTVTDTEMAEALRHILT